MGLNVIGQCCFCVCIDVTVKLSSFVGANEKRMQPLWYHPRLDQVHAEAHHVKTVVSISQENNR